MARKVTNRYVEDPRIRSMRVRTWYRAVALASGLTPRELEQEFSEKKPGRTTSPRSCIWDKYRRGEVVPRNGPAKNEASSLAERVECRYPGTAQWLDSPLWRLADKAPMEMSELRCLYERLAKPIRTWLIADIHPPALFWRRSVDPEEPCKSLAGIDDVQALITLLALAKEAETIQDQWQHYVAVRAIRVNLRTVTAGGVLDKNIRAELRAFLDERWRDPGYLRGCVPARNLGLYEQS